MFYKKSDMASIVLILLSVVFELAVLIYELLMKPIVLTEDIYSDKLGVYFIVCAILAGVFILFNFATRYTKNDELFNKYNFFFLSSSFYTVFVIIGIMYAEMTPLFLLFVLMFDVIKFDFVRKFLKMRKESSSYESFVMYYDKEEYVSKNRLVGSFSIFILVTLYVVGLILYSLFRDITFEKNISLTFLHIALFVMLLMEYLRKKEKYFFFVLGAMIVSYGLFTYTNVVFIPRVSDLARSTQVAYTAADLAQEPFLIVAAVLGSLALVALAIGYFSSKITLMKTVHFISPVLLNISVIFIPGQKSSLGGTASVDFSDVWLFTFINLTIILCGIIMWKNKREDDFEEYEKSQQVRI